MNQNQQAPQVNTSPTALPVSQPSVRPVYRPYVTYILIGICVVVYLVQAGTSYLLGVDLPAAFGVKDNSLIIQGQIWRLFTPMFLHGSILHIGFNMYALFYIGPMLERFYGRWRYLSLFILSGFAGNVISFMFSPYQSLGSSTSIFGLLGAEGVLIYQNREIFGSIARRALSQVVIIAVINLIIGLTPGIDNWGHIGGLIGGTLFAWFGGPILERYGVSPPFTLVDARGRREALVAGSGVGVLFIFLTVVAMFMRRG
ncbi:MAG: rhomboid family intramembrane serine protease [Anaerolineales bacterium]